MKIILWAVLAIGLVIWIGVSAALIVGCSTLAQNLIKDASGAVCEIVVQATDPALSPICTTVLELEAVLQDLAQARKVGAFGPTQDEIYDALRKRHEAS